MIIDNHIMIIYMVVISMMILTTKRVGDIPTPTFPFLLGRGTASGKSMFYVYLIVDKNVYDVPILLLMIRKEELIM